MNGVTWLLWLPGTKVSEDKDLDELMAQATAAVARKPPAIAKVSYNHAAMIDLLIANPTISQNDLADHFGLTASWVSRVIVSDAFQTELAKRRAEIVDPALRTNVENNFKAMILRSQELLLEKLSKPAAEVKDSLLVKALEIGSRAQGYGVKDSAPAPGNVPDIHLHLEQLGGGLVALLQRKKLEALPQASTPADHQAAADSIEGDFTDVTEASG